MTLLQCDMTENAEDTVGQMTVMTDDSYDRWQFSKIERKRVISIIYIIIYIILIIM